MKVSMNLIPKCSNWCIKLVDASILLITIFAHSRHFCSPDSSLIFRKSQNLVEWDEIIDDGGDNGFMLLIHVQCEKEQRSDLSARVHLSRCVLGRYTSFESLLIFSIRAVSTAISITQHYVQIYELDFWRNAGTPSCSPVNRLHYSHWGEFLNSALNVSIIWHCVRPNGELLRGAQGEKINQVLNYLKH